MKIPRDINAERLAALLARYGYRALRQTGSHVRLFSDIQSSEHHITIPRHGYLKIGTLSHILNEVAGYLEKDRKTIIEELFG